MRLLLNLLFFITCQLIINSISALSPPAYLQVEDFRQCLITYNIGGASFLCLPNTMPELCILNSWDKLITMDITKCDSSNPGIETDTK